MPKDIEVEIFLKGGKTFIKNVKQTGKAAEKAGESFSKGQKNLVSFAAGLSIVTTAARAALRVVGVLVDIGAAAVKTGSDFQEANSKFNQVFKGVAEESREMREELTKNFGLSRLAATDLLSTTGDLLTGFGFTDKAALELSNTVAELAVDVASFSNVQGGAARVNRILTKSLLGEREGLKELGIAVLEADVKNRILEKGQSDLTGAQLRQAKAVATLELAYEQSAKAVGDFARTSDQLANQQRILNNNLEDIETTIGIVLVPIMQTFTGELIKATDNTEDWIEANKELIASDLVEFAKLVSATITFAGQAALFTAKTFLALKGAGAIVGESFIQLSIDASRSFAFILDGVSILAKELTRSFNVSIQGIKKLFIELAQSTADIILSAEDFLPDSVVSNVKDSLFLIKKSLKDSTELDTSGENLFSEVLKGTSAVVRENITLLEERKQKAIDDQVETANQIQSINDLSSSLTSLNSNIQDGLNAVGGAADRGTLFTDTIANIKKQTEEEKAAAEERSKIAKEEIDAKRQATADYNNFLLKTEDGQIEAARRLSESRLAGLADELSQKGELLTDDNELKKDIEITLQEDIFAIREGFREKELAADQTFQEALRAEFGVTVGTFRDQGQIATAAFRDFSVEAFQTVKAAADDLFVEMILGTADTKQAFEALGKILLKQFVSNLTEMLIQQILFDKTASTVEQIAGRAKIGTSAAVGAAAAAASALAGLPYPSNIAAAAASSASEFAAINAWQAFIPVRAQHGIESVQRAEQPALLHLGETVLTRDETSILSDFLRESGQNSGETTSGGGLNVTLQIDNLTLMADDDEAIGNLTTAIRRQLEEQNLVAIQ